MEAMMVFLGGEEKISHGEMFPERRRMPCAVQAGSQRGALLSSRDHRHTRRNV
jgi:hypothetical protein